MHKYLAELGLTCVQLNCLLLPSAISFCDHRVFYSSTILSQRPLFCVSQDAHNMPCVLQAQKINCIHIFHARCQSVSPEVLSLFSGNYTSDIQNIPQMQIYFQMPE